MKKKKKQLELHKRRLELDDQLLNNQAKAHSKSWLNFVTIAYLLQIALLMYFVIATLMTSSQEQPFSLTLWIFMGIALAFTGYAIFQLFTVKNTIPFSTPLRKPIGTKVDRFVDTFAKVTTYISYAVTALNTCMPRPYSLTIWVAIIHPLLLILIIKCSGNRITLNRKDNGNRDFSIPLIMSLIPIFFHAVFDFTIDSSLLVWHLIVGLSLSLVLLIIKNIQTLNAGSDNDNRYINFFCIWVLLLIYTLSLIRIANCYFDTPVQKQQAYVVSKGTSKSKKNRSYWVEISPIGKEGTTEKQSVGTDTYQNAKPGNAVKVYYYNGALLAPWHEVYF